jgi:competence protein ComEC
VALLYVGGVLAAELVRPPPLPLLCFLLVLATTALSWPHLRLVLLYTIVFLAGLANATLHTAVLSPVDIRNLVGLDAQLVTIRGELIETPTLRVYQHDQQPSWRTLARLDLKSVCLGKEHWQPATGQVAITTPGVLTNYFSGQIVEVSGVLAPPRLAVADGTFDYRRYLHQQGIYYQLRTESESDWHVLESPSGRPLVDRFTAWARQALAQGLPAEDEALRLEWALALGWKTALTEEASEPFVQAATYHIFAVDGLRMAILFGIFYSVLRAIGIPRPLGGVLLIPLIWFYVALTGWPASAIRASVMLTIIILGWVLKRPANPINSLLTAALIILVWEPQQLFQAGFQLSFIVVLGLILMIPPLFKLIQRVTAPDPLLPAQLRPKWNPIFAVPTRYLGDLSITSFAAWVGSLPLVAYYFNIVTPISTPANVIAVPLCVLVLISNLISLSLAAWVPGLAELFNHAGWFWMECIRVSSEWFAKCPFAYFYTPAPGLFTTCLFYAAFLGIVSGWIFQPALRFWKLAAMGALTLAWSLNCYQQLRTTQLTVLPANGGTSIYFDSFGTKNDLLVDVGASNSVAYTARPFLRAQGVTRLPKLLLTHGDIHHVGDTELLVQQFNVSCIYTNPLRFRSSAYRRTLEHLGQTPGLLRSLNRGDRIGDWTVLHPDRTDRFSKADDGAVVLRADLAGTRILLLSDLGQAGQAKLLERIPDLHAEILVAGLPTTGEPLSERLLKAIEPRLVIVSDSEFPVSERARPRLRSRLKRTQIPTLFMRDTGAVTLQFRNNYWKARSMSGIAVENTDSAAQIWRAIQCSQLTQREVTF